MGNVCQEMMLGALQAYELGHLVKQLHVLQLQVVQLLDVGLGQLVLHEHAVELDELQPRNPRRVSPHGIGEQRRDDRMAVVWYSMAWRAVGLGLGYGMVLRMV